MTEPHDRELLPCIGCGYGGPVMKQWFPHPEHGWMRECPGCKMCTGQRLTKDDADIAWNEMNTRAATPAAAVPQVMPERLQVAINDAVDSLMAIPGDTYRPHDPEAAKELMSAVVEATEKEQPTAAAVPRWIACSERMPSDSVRVLIGFAGDLGAVGQARWDGVQEIWHWSEGWGNPTPSHWMPLPPPPSAHPQPTQVDDVRKPSMEPDPLEVDKGSKGSLGSGLDDAREGEVERVARAIKRAYYSAAPSPLPVPNEYFHAEAIAALRGGGK
jgi:hypothetical protein